MVPQLCHLPPVLHDEDVCFPGHERRYADFLDAKLPRAESLENFARMLPYWRMRIEPTVTAVHTALVIAHGIRSSVTQIIDDAARRNANGGHSRKSAGNHVVDLHQRDLRFGQ